MCYKNTFITIAEDSTATSGLIPSLKNEKPTIPYIEYDLIKNNSYKYTQEDVQFITYLIKNQIDTDQIDDLREQFFEKPKACFRASPLVKKYGWGIHYDGEGKIAIYGVNSEEYNRLLNLDSVTKVKGMRTKRK